MLCQQVSVDSSHESYLTVADVFFISALLKKKKKAKTSHSLPDAKASEKVLTSSASAPVTVVAGLAIGA